MEGTYARLEGRNFDFYMSKKRVVIGRNSKLGDVDVNMGSSRFVSRKHLEITLDRNRFFLLCRGKNGVFVDDVFQRRENRRIPLPSQCIIRFPSTQIKLAFTSLLEEMGPPSLPSTSPAHPLKIDTTLTSPFVSPMPSPTGTISAINSCPASPNSEYHRRMPSFDFMAKYASKLLSSTASDGEGPSNAVEEEGEEEGEENAPEAQPTPQEPEEGAVGDQEAKEQAKQPDKEEEEGAEKKSHLKPPYSYAQLIVQALLASKDRKQTLSSIYQFISERYPYYKLEDKGWKNSIRHNLSLNQYFMKAPREKEGLGFGKGGYWCMHPDYEEKLLSQAYVKRKKKGIPVFPHAGLMSRSAPPSPTHHPVHPTELNPRELEAKFAMPTQPTTSHFALPPFLSQISSSHSLPASPSRPHPSSFTATPLKFFPATIRSSSSTEALALERPCKVICEPIPEEDQPSSKKPRLELEGEGSEGKQNVPRAIQLPTITSLPTVQFSQPGAMQFLSIPLMTSSAPQPAGVQAIYNQPLSSFLPQNFFAGHHPSLPPSQDSPSGEEAP